MPIFPGTTKGGKICQELEIIMLPFVKHLSRGSDIWAPNYLETVKKR